ncbi:MAG: N-acetyltransferase [Meiothermus sp.]|nr:N-acetyltransferase [Meiothermus sp.]
MDHGELSSRPVTDLTSPDLVEVLNRGFEDYILPVQFQVVGLEQRMGREHLDRSASQVFYLDKQPVGVVMVDRRGWNSRIGAMGIAKPFRGRGLGKRMLGQIVQAARGRGDRDMVLEAFEDNTAAVRLYQSLGFRVTRRLVGYSKPAQDGGAETLTEIDPLEFSRIVGQEGDSEPPWMLAAETFAGYGAPSRAFALGGAAFALAQDTPGPSFILWGLVVRRALRRQGWGTRALEALMHLHAGKSCQVPQIVPEGLAPEFFARSGFALTQLNQVEMHLDLIG